MNPLVRMLIAAAIVLGCSFAGCAGGAIIGYIIFGEGWTTLHGGFIVTFLLVLVLGFIGLIAGVFIAARNDSRISPGASGSAPRKG